MSVGWNPTFPDVKAEDFYDCELRLIVCGFVRPEAKFADFKDLIVAIREDGDFCRETLETAELAAIAKDLSPERSHARARERVRWNAGPANLEESGEGCGVAKVLFPTRRTVGLLDF
eukprot:g1435.t1